MKKAKNGAEKVTPFLGCYKLSVVQFVVFSNSPVSS